MAKSKPANRRGSPEAIEKRRAARYFNDVLGGRAAGRRRLDGRTEKRRLRLLRELESGKARSRDLKPLDVLAHVQELLELGETVGSLRKVAKVKKSAVLGEEVAVAVSRLHRAYGFRPEVYRFLGIGEDVLKAAGVLGKPERENHRGASLRESRGEAAQRKRR